MKMDLTLLILAAGVGRRYGGLKQLESVGPAGETLLEYSIYDAVKAGFNRAVLVIRPETEKEFQEALSPRISDRVALSYAYQRTSDVPNGVAAPVDRVKPWGTGQAVLAAEAEIGGPFAVVNADDFYGADSFAVLSDFLQTTQSHPDRSYALAGYKVGPTLPEAGAVTRGLCRSDADDRLQTILEVRKLERYGDGARYTAADGEERLVSGDALVSMNMWGFTPAVFDQLRARFREFLIATTNGSSEFLLPDIIQAMIADGSAAVRVLRHHGAWCGITYPRDREPVRKFISALVARGDYPSPLWS
jgi:NDP-sugar pyrophosphorylase family protein